MSDSGLGQPVKFESLTGTPCALKASLIWVQISPKYANLETTACGLPSGHSCLPPVYLLIAEERGKRLGGKGDIYGYTPKHIDYAGKDYGLGSFAQKRPFGA